MENQLQPYNNTLMGELGAWNKEEIGWANAFGQKALEDRDFLKLKLQEYERLSFRFGQGMYPTDHRYTILILNFQRKKLERAIYPSRIRRLIHKIGLFLAPPINGKKEMAMASEVGLVNYARVQIPVREGQPLQQQQKQEQQQPRRHWQNQGQRREGHNKGKSL